MIHLPTAAIAGTCRSCGSYGYEGVHMVNLDLYCPACCPVCRESAGSADGRTGHAGPETALGANEGSGKVVRTFGTERWAVNGGRDGD